MSRFESTIDATDPGGNIFSILGQARRWMKELNLPSSEIEALSDKVMGSGSYDEAVGHIEEYFPVDRGDL